MKFYKYFSFLLLLLVGFILFLTGCTSYEKSGADNTEKPHILIILVDDMGYGDLKSYSPDSKIPTPNLDKLASEGMRFTDAHAPGAVCHPSRYGLLTGRYPFRTNTNVWPDQPVIDEDRMTIATLLQSEGYQTAMVGKWHLGFDESEAIKATQQKSKDGDNNTKAAFRRYKKNQKLSGGPVDRGFDSFFGIRASTDIPPYFYIRGDRVVDPPTDTIESNYSDSIWTDIQGAFWREGGIAPDLELDNVLPLVTRESINVIEEHASNRPERPLFLYVALPAPHTPWLPTAEFEGVSSAGMYGDFMTMVDAQIGKILSALKEQNMSKNTLVIFTSDNGPVWYDKDKQHFGHDSQGRLRGMKGDAYEAGHRMPFIIRWPGVTEAGRETDQTISFTDLMATFADILDRPLPEHAGEDSFSLLPVLRGEQPEGEAVRLPVVSVSSRGVRSIQDGQWKLIESLGSGGFTDPVFVEPEPGGPEGQLYNLEEDLKETNNLWNEHPDVVSRLMSMLEDYDNKGRSRPGK